MLFSGKKNVFMCLVVFQKIFRKIFSGVWKMLQGKDKTRKTNTAPKLTLDARLGSTARCFTSSNSTTAPSIAISRSTAPLRKIAILRSVDRDQREGEITIDGSISWSVDRDLAKHRADPDRCEGEFAISDRNRQRWCLRTAPTGAWCVRMAQTGYASLSLSLSLSLSGIHLKWK